MAKSGTKVAHTTHSVTHEQTMDWLYLEHPGGFDAYEWPLSLDGFHEAILKWCAWWQQDVGHQPFSGDVLKDTSSDTIRLVREHFPENDDPYSHALVAFRDANIHFHIEAIGAEAEIIEATRELACKYDVSLSLVFLFPAMAHQLEAHSFQRWPLKQQLPTEGRAYEKEANRIIHALELIVSLYEEEHGGDYEEICPEMARGEAALWLRRRSIGPEVFQELIDHLKLEAWATGEKAQRAFVDSFLPSRRQSKRSEIYSSFDALQQILISKNYLSDRGVQKGLRELYSTWGLNITSEAIRKWRERDVDG